MAALIYLVAAVLAGAPAGRTVLELIGVVAFGADAAAGAWCWPRLLALGWTVHVVLVESAQPVTYAPWWYPALCTGFDLVVAAFVLMTWRAPR